MNETAKKKNETALKVDLQGTDTRITLGQFARATGVSYRTAAAYAQKAGWTKNGKTTWLDEKQQTIILEAVKQANSNQYDLASSLQGTETALSPALKLEMLYRQIDEIKTAEIARLNADLAATRRVLDMRTAGLETIQRIAEAGGLVMSDRDDIETTYRRRR